MVLLNFLAIQLLNKSLAQASMCLISDHDFYLIQSLKQEPVILLEVLSTVVAFLFLVLYDFSKLIRAQKLAIFSYFLSTIFSIIKASALIFSSSISPDVSFCMGISILITFYLGKYLSMISKGVNPYRQTSQPFTKEMISRILLP